MLVFCILNLILRSNTNMIKDREIKEARSVMIGRDNLMWIIQLDFQQILNYFYYILLMDRFNMFITIFFSFYYYYYSYPSLH